MRFLLTRRWVVFLLVVAALAWLAVQLGDWQFRRLDQRRADNALIRHNLAAPSLPVEEVMRVDHGLPQDDEWRILTARGTWDSAKSVVVRYRTRDGASGVDVVTPLVTASGAAVLVDRGWMATENKGSDRPALPPVVKGKVTVSGYARVDATGGSTRVDDLSTRAISSPAIARATGLSTYGGFLELERQSPTATDRLAKNDLPELDDGPHLFYGLQWWFFGALAVIGFGYLAYDEWRRRRDPESTAG